MRVVIGLFALQTLTFASWALGHGMLRAGWWPWVAHTVTLAGASIVPSLYVVIVLAAGLTVFGGRWRRAGERARPNAYGVGLLIASGGGLTSNVVIPAATGDASFTHLGPYLGVPLIALTAHTLVRAQRQDHQLVPHRGLTYALAPVLLVVPLVALLLVAAHPMLARFTLIEVEMILAGGLCAGLLLWMPPIRERAERAFRDRGPATSEPSAAALHRLTQMLAHEIGNPLVPIKTLTKLLPARAGDPAFASDVSRIVSREIERIERLVARLRRLAPTDEPLQAMVDLRVPIRHAIEVVGAEAAGNGTRIDVTLAPSPVPVRGNSAELEELFLNLLTNAIEAVVDREAERSIRISVAAERDRAVATVRDSGPGIRVEVIDKLFETCVTTKPRGSGLGLAICKTIAERHRGRLTAANAADGGAVFTLELPVAA